MPSIKKISRSPHQEDAAVLNNGVGGCDLTKREALGKAGESYRKGDIVRLVSHSNGSHSVELMNATVIDDIMSRGWIVIETYSDTADEGVTGDSGTFMMCAKLYDQGFYEINFLESTAPILDGSPAQSFNITDGRLEAAEDGAIVTAIREEQMRRPDQEADDQFLSMVVNLSYTVAPLEKIQP